MDKAFVIPIVRDVVNDLDPVGLLLGGAPLDEYEVEISDIAGRISRVEFDGNYSECVREVFHYWFRPIRLREGMAEKLGSALKAALVIDKK